jgi:arylformamidase
MKIFDISLPLSSSSVVWPGDPPVVNDRTASIANGDICNLTRINLGAHTGTHVDAPVHFIDGAAGVETLELGTLIGEAQVLDVTKAETITAAVLQKNVGRRVPKRLLLKTRNSLVFKENRGKFDKNFAAVEADAAQWIVDHGISLVGIDCYSIAPFDRPLPTHKILLAANVVIVEGLNLSEIAAGQYTFICLPLKIVGSDGSPVRAVLVDKTRLTRRAAMRKR